MKKILAVAVFSLIGCALFAQSTWKPARPIQIVVPWAAGGSSDRTIRPLAPVLEKELNQKIVIVNQPGASGTVGTKTVIDAPRDGYMWASGASADIGTYRYMNLLQTDFNDWNLYLAFLHVSVICVKAGSPYKTYDDLIKAVMANPGKVTFATAGVSSAGKMTADALKSHYGDKFDFKHVTYDSGTAAAIAVVGGEADVCTQLSSEQVDMIRAKRLIPLAVMASNPLDVKGYGAITPITRFVPSFKNPPANYFGIFIPKGVPADVISTMNDVWKKIASSQALKDYAAENAIFFTPIYGSEAVKASMPLASFRAHMMYDSKASTVDPATMGIPRM